jgi:hypothetical protein
MVFKGANAWLFQRHCGNGCRGGGKLEVNVGFMEKGFQGGRCLIVKLLETRLEAVGTKDSMASFLGSEDGGSSLAFHGFSMNEIGVVGVKDEELGVALTQR